MAAIDHLVQQFAEQLQFSRGRGWLSRGLSPKQSLLSANRTSTALLSSLGGRRGRKRRRIALLAELTGKMPALPGPCPLCVRGKLLGGPQLEQPQVAADLAQPEQGI